MDLTYVKYGALFAILILKDLDIGQESRQEMMIIMGTTTSFALNPKKKYLGQANLAQALNSVRAFPPMEFP